MQSRKILVSCLLVSCVLFGQRLDAQPPVPEAGGAASNMVTEFQGQLKSFQRGILLVTRDDGTEVMIQLPEDISSFNFIAEAKPAFLQRGAMIRFSGVFDSNGVALSPIQNVEVFQPIATPRMPGHLRERYVPGIYPEKRGEANAQQAMAKYNIVGGLMGIDGTGWMMVQAGNTQLRVPLAAEAKFELRFNNLSLAKEGDPVSVAGFYQPPDDTKVRADRVTITPDRVYGEVSEQQPPQRRTRRSIREEAAKKKLDAAAAEKEKAAQENGDAEKVEGEGVEGEKEAGEQAEGEKVSDDDR